MKFLLLSFFMLVSSFAIAQNNWLRSAGGENHDEAFDMAATSDDHFAVVGYFGSGATFGSVNLSSSGFSDAFVQKIDAAGNTIWAKKLGGTKPDRATSVACDDDGNIYVTGFFTDEATFGNITLDEVGDSLEIFITKLNSDGVVQWAKVCGGVSDDFSYGIAVDDEANVIVTGQFREVGHFGNFTLTSDMYEDDSYWSYDVFVTKLDTDGNFLWAEKGSAADDDRGLSVTTDNFNNIYVCGQFSDTITFDQLHLNEVANAGFLIKYSPDGEEQWFDKLAASQLVTYDVTTDLDHNILLTGEYSGQLAIFNDGIDFVPAGYTFNIFLSKFGQTGNMIWSSHAGSNNFCSAKAVCVGASNEAYVTGTFNCVMTEFSDEYGEGIFNSVGYRDVFVTRFNLDGERTWERQFASSKDDYCAAIAYQGIVDKPLIAGSYSNYFNVPSDQGFSYALENNLDSWNYYLPNCDGVFCGDNFYPYFIQVKADGNKDIFLSSPVSLEREPYDYYNRNLYSAPPCDKPMVEPCLSDLYQYGCGENTCSDSILMCNASLLFLNTNTGSSGFVGPAYDYLWSNGSSIDQIVVSSSGWYWTQTIREDGCDVFVDSVYVTVAPYLCPSIIDNAGFNDNAECYPNDVTLCAPDSVLLTASDFDDSQYWWIEENQWTIDSSASIYANESGTYSFIFIDDYGCQRSSYIEVNVIYTIDTITPQMLISMQPALDTIATQTCDNTNDCISISLIDLYPNPPGLFEQNVEVDWMIYQNGNLVAQSLNGSTNFCYSPPAEGLYHVVAAPTIVHPWPCDSVIPYPSLEGWFTYEILEAPVVSLSISGELFICPGDTTFIVASGADQLVFSGDYPFILIGDTAILVDEFGWYSVYGVSMLNGCVDEGNYSFQVLSKPAPYAWMEPASGVVCPGDSVQLWCEEGFEYHWIGPLGNELDNTQSIYVSVPGFYYCILTDYSGCILESNMVEVKEYSTPYLIAYPGTDLCVNGQILVQIATNDFESILWGNPFNDSATEQWIYEEGVYNVSVTSCGITTDLDITITDSDTPAFITPSDLIFCPNDTITLAANGGMQGYNWQPGNVPYENLEVTEPGTYYLTTYDALGCLGTASYTVVEYEIENPVASGTTICIGESILLTATSNSTMYWTADEEGQEVVANGSTFSTPYIFEETIYYVFSQDEVCASAATEVVIEIYFSSMPPIFEGDYAVCLGADALLISPMEAGMEYEWTLPNGSTTTADSIFIYNATEVNEGYYFLTVTDENCTATDSLLFEVVPQEILQLDEDNFIEECEGNSIAITSPVEADVYTWNTPSGIFNGPQTLLINAASQINVGVYTLTLTNAVCDFEILPITVEVNPYPNIELDPCTYYCDDGYMTIGFQEEYDWYLWSTGDTDASVEVPDSGWYSVQVANNPDCMVQTEVYVPTMECIEGFLNVMTCNGDGLNDFADFGVLRAKIDAVYIYNRWGNLIETLTPTRLVWNGTGRTGERVSSGVYFYTIDYAPAQPNDCGCYLPPEGYIHVFAE